MFKNRKSTLLAKKSSDLLGTVSETESSGNVGGPGPSQKIARLDGETDDLFSVPASQINSQKYVSQRNYLSRSQSVRTSRRVPSNYFESILLKCLVDLDEPTSIVLKCEPITFVRKLRTMLRASPDYPRNVKDFVNGVEIATKNKEAFRKLLECCQLQNQTTSDLKPVQESLIKLLLCVDFLQLELITVLFDYVEKSVAEGSGGVNMTGLILSQIKFIDHTVHGTLVFNKYFAVLERSRNASQLLAEAIVSLEDVIDVAMQDAAFRKILELFPRAEELFTPTNVNVFCEMCLSGGALRITRQRIVDFVEEGCPVEIYPSLVKFLLKFNCNELDGLHENIHEIRQVVDRLVQLWKDGSSDKYLKEIFEFVYQSLTVSAVLYEAWIKFCRLLTDEDSHMSLDLLVLLMMLTVNEIKSGGIQKMLINKIKKRHLTIAHMKELTKYFGCVLKTHMDCVLDFVETCLKEKQTEVCEFGVMSMSYLFSADNINNKLVLNKLVGFMCEMALINEGQRNDHLIAVCLNALSNIYASYPNDIRNNAHILLKIMDISTDLSLQQYRTAVSLICESIHVPESPIGGNETWDSINIVIKKQLLSNNKEVKKKGVVGVVRLIQHLLKNSSENVELNCSFDSEKTIASASEVPTAAGREIANIINMMLTSSNESTDILALCYDEMAEMLLDFERNVGKPEKAATIWLCDFLTNDFQNYFIVEEVPKGDVVQYAKKLCINDTSDVENTNAEAYAISVNIADNMLAYNSRYSTMCFFLSLFKLMKSLQAIRYDGNLESINALLGCSIIVPSFYGEPDEQTMVETFEEDICRQLLDAYFYVANWFRELINAFVQQTDPLMHRKVLQRLSALVSLEHRLGGLLRTVDFDYYPPICDFTTTNNPTKPAKPAKESSSKQNVTINGSKTQLDATGKPRQGDQASDFESETVYSRHKQGFRVMDGQVMKLFRESLLLYHKLPEGKIGECLGLAEYRFLLETVTVEVESQLSARAKQRSSYKLKDLLSILPFIVKNFIEIKAKCRELHTLTSAGTDSEFKALLCCFNWSLRLFTAVLQMLKLQQHDLLDSTLQILGKLAPSYTEDQTNEDLVEQILSSELTHKNAFKNLFTASCLYKFGCATNNAVPVPKGPTTIGKFCQNFICSKFQPKSGNPTQLTLMLQGVFTVIDFSKIKRLTKALGEDLGGSKTDEKSFVGLQRGHYALLFKELCKAFIKCIQSEMRAKKTTVQKFVLWEQSCEILKQFSEVVKQADNFKIYACYMRYSHIYLKLFQQSGLKALEDILKVSADRVSHLLGTLQHSTRYLHNICCHSKSAKDNSLAAQVPFIRETVETLIYSVKAVLAANDCASVFWMGNLKNKDLKGVLIISQDEPELEEESGGESDIADFLSDDEDGKADQPCTSLRKGNSGEKSSQSKCF